MLLYEIMGDALPPNDGVMLNICGICYCWKKRLGEMNGYLLTELVLEFLEADGWIIVVDVLRVSEKGCNSGFRLGQTL
jgi:hypothetical protein